MDKDFIQAALDYHRLPAPGKISVTPTKPLTNQRDLALAYSPGVAAACEAIAADPAQAAELTSRSNLVAVISNGTAVLGLGNIGPLASKPVMEGKGCLFKKFAGIDVFDIELNENDPDKLIDIVAALEPTLGGINLEDIKAPECFYIEQKLRERLQIPVFHDDQHGTAIISSSALLNGLKVVGKDIGKIKLVCSGAGAAAIACLDLMVGLGLKRENIYVCDSKGVIYTGREENMEANKARYAQNTTARTLGDVMDGADVFLGLSTAGVLKPEMVSKMAKQPLIFALANPTPEIMPELARQARPDAIIATGRSDYPNQVNNVLCFPFIFRGALDVGATKITDEMKLACVEAIAELAQAELSDEVATAYEGQDLRFGPEYLIPKPFDPRLIMHVAPAVAEAAMRSGVATRPLADIDAYREHLKGFVYRTGAGMRTVFAEAKQVSKTQAKRVVYAEGEEERVLAAANIVLQEGIAKPVVIGRPEIIEKRLEKLGLRIRPGIDFELIDPQTYSQFEKCWQGYQQRMTRQGVTPNMAKVMLRRDNTLIGAMLLELGYVDGMICGAVGRYQDHLNHVEGVIGRKSDANVMAAMNFLMLPKRALFICDTHVNENPSAEELAEIVIMAAENVRRFGVEPKAALLSHSNFGSAKSASASKVAQALALVKEQAPQLEIDGEMHGDSALSEDIRYAANPNSSLSGEANLLVLPNIDAANIAYNLLKMTGSEGITIGPILLGAAKPVHVLTASATVRRIVNLTAVTVVDTHQTA